MSLRRGGGGGGWRKGNKEGKSKKLVPRYFNHANTFYLPLPLPLTLTHVFTHTLSEHFHRPALLYGLGVFET